MADTATAAPRIVNGVNVNAITNTITAIQGNAEIAKFNFRLKNTWVWGEVNRSTIRDFDGACETHRNDGKTFALENGEHQVLLGEDRAPNPVEYVLHALIGCMTTTTAYHAAARGIAVEAIDSEVDGDLDLRGFLGLSEEVRKGYSAIRVKMRVKTKADAAAIKEITTFSPVFDIVSKSVPVAVAVETY